MKCTMRVCAQRAESERVRLGMAARISVVVTRAAKPGSRAGESGVRRARGAASARRPGAVGRQRTAPLTTQITRHHRTTEHLAAATTVPVCRVGRRRRSAHRALARVAGGKQWSSARAARSRTLGPGVEGCMRGLAVAGSHFHLPFPQSHTRYEKKGGTERRCLRVTPARSRQSAASPCPEQTVA